MTHDQDEGITEVIERERSRLRAFIRRQVADPADAEDILQDVLFQLVEATRLLMPIDHLTGWLYRVTRNRIIDGFRKKRPERLPVPQPDDEGERLGLDELLPSPDAGPEAVLERQWLLAALESAISGLPADQRDVFVAHELEGRSFKELAAGSGVSVNTLLSRKRYAVLRLREALQEVHDELEEE